MSPNNPTVSPSESDTFSPSNFTQAAVNKGGSKREEPPLIKHIRDLKVRFATAKYLGQSLHAMIDEKTTDETNRPLAQRLYGLSIEGSRLLVDIEKDVRKNNDQQSKKSLKGFKKLNVIANELQGIIQQVKFPEQQVADADHKEFVGTEAAAILEEQMPIVNEPVESEAA
jgi:hypothetical protein